MSFTWIRPVAPTMDDAPPPAGELVAAPEAGAPPSTAIAAPGQPPGDQRQAKLGKALETAYHYLQDNAPSHPGLASAITEMHAAVAAFQSGGDTLSRIERVLDAIETQRQLDPSIPQP
jgi:hypothetical protein